MNTPPLDTISVDYDEAAQSLKLACIDALGGEHDVRKSPPPNISTRADALKFVAEYIKKHFELTIPPANFAAAFGEIRSGKNALLKWDKLRPLSREADIEETLQWPSFRPPLRTPETQKPSIQDHEIS